MSCRRSRAVREEMGSFGILLAPRMAGRVDSRDSVSFVGSQTSGACGRPVRNRLREGRGQPRASGFSLRAPRNWPLRTGRCRVRRLRSSFTIATSPGRSPTGERLKPDCSRHPLAGPRVAPRSSSGGRPIRGPPKTQDASNAQYGDNYKRMNELSKDAVSWLTVGEDAAGQRVDNFLSRILKGVPKSHIYRILRSGEVRINKGRAGPDARLALGDVVRVPPVRTSAPARTRCTAAAALPKA